MKKIEAIIKPHKLDDVKDLIEIAFIDQVGRFPELRDGVEGQHREETIDVRYVDAHALKFLERQRGITQRVSEAFVLPRRHGFRDLYGDQVARAIRLDGLGDRVQRFLVLDVQQLVQVLLQPKLPGDGGMHGVVHAN